MADATTKYIPKGGTLKPDFKTKTLFSFSSSILKTRKTLTFAYAFTFAFVAFTVFLAFFPSPNTSSPFFTNIFSSTATTASSTTSYKSQLSSIFSFFFHNTTTTSSSATLNTNTTRSSNSTSQTSAKTFKNTPFDNQTQTTPTTKKIPIDHTARPHDHTQVSDEDKALKKTNQSSSIGVVKNGSNETDSRRVKDDELMESLIKCDFFDGEWIKDESYPLYEPGSCNIVDEQFNCIQNGRPDKNYQKFKWKPKGCSIPRYENSW